MQHSVEEMCIAGCTTRRGIRFWESEGLLGEVARTDGDTRRYTPDQLNKAKIIAAAQFGGWTLEAIGKMLAGYDKEAHDAILIRLSDQARAAARLAENLPAPLPVEYDL